MMRYIGVMLGLLVCGSVLAVEMERHYQGAEAILAAAVQNSQVRVHADYQDLTIPEAAGAELLFEWRFPRNRRPVGVTVATEIQASQAAGAYLQCEVAAAVDGPWIPLYVQRAATAYAFEWQQGTLADWGNASLWVRLRFGGCWTDDSGHADLSLRALRIAAETVEVPSVEITFPERYNVFTTEEPVRFSPLRPGRYLLRDQLGRVAAEVAATEAEREIGVPGLPPGFYHLEREGEELGRLCVVADGIQARAQKSVAQVDFGRNGNWPLAKTRRAAKLAQLAGVNWIRERWGWGWPSMEPERGKLITGPMEEFLRVEQEYGLKVTFIFMATPAWAGSGYGDNLFDTYHSARTFGEHFAGLIQCWEYWNEPDSWPFGKGPVQNYAAGQKAAYLGFRAADPNGACYRVASAGNSSIARANFIDDMLANGVGAYCDIYNSHIYELPERYAGTYDHHQQLLRTHALENRAKWITEGGAENARIDLKAVTVPYPMEYMVPDQDQDTARCDVLPAPLRDEVTGTLIKSWTLSAAWRWERYFTFCFGYYNEGGRIWGLLAPGMTATTSYAALATYNHLLGDSDYLGMFQPAVGVSVHVFGNGKRLMAVAWSDGGTVALPPDIAVAAVYAATGERCEPDAVTITAMPLYLELAAMPSEMRRAAHFEETVVPAIGAEAPRIVLDFVRDQSESPHPVNTQRQYLITRPNETITGTLYCYNFDDQAREVTIRAEAPERWQVALGADTVTVPAQERVAIRVELSAPPSSDTEEQRIRLTTADGAGLMVPFRFDAALGVEKLESLLEVAQGVAIAPSTVAYFERNAEKILQADYAGDTPSVQLTAALPPGMADGVCFTLERIESGNQPSYLDVTVINADGSESCLRPNIFPVFLDGVRRESHTIAYAELTPATDAQHARSVRIGCSSFLTQPMEMKVIEFSTFRRRAD